MLDIELNSLEDAFIKIAESDYREKEVIKNTGSKSDYAELSAEDEAKVMEDYFKYEGRQNFCSKILYVSAHRLWLFYRSSF